MHGFSRGGYTRTLVSNGIAVCGSAKELSGATVPSVGSATRGGGGFQTRRIWRYVMGE